MADDSSQEKTEDATPKRIRKAREQGQVPKSRDLSTVFVLVVVFAVLSIGMKFFGQTLGQSMQATFQMIEKDPLTAADLYAAGKIMLICLVKILVPVLLSGMVAGTMVSFLQVGAVFSTDPLTPKFEKLNPIEGLKNMFKVVTFIELIKNIAKLIVVFYIAYQTINKFSADILRACSIDPLQSASITGGILYSFFVKVCVVFFAIALADMALQRWNFMKNMRMSKDEIKREYKQDEGDPHIKGERRRQHREMVFGDVKRNVKKADAVVTNPTHVAVAIQYNRDEMAAPEVLVKGQRKFAELIIQIAKEENVPIIRNIPLAWSLLQIDEGDAIPADLYDPVAEVLCLVYEMRQNQASNQTASHPASENSKPKTDSPRTTFKPL